MKRSGFKMKLRKPMKRTLFKRKPTSKVKKPKREKLPTVKSVRNKCDALLTPIIKKLFPYSLLSGRPTEVAHHHVHKSKSTRLRYDMDNLIPLTHKEHQALHHNESYWASKIVEIKGIEWFKKIDKAKDEIVKANVHYYISNYQRLKDIHEKGLNQG